MFRAGKKRITAGVTKMVKSIPWGKSLPFSSVLMVTKIVTSNFQVDLYDEMYSNSTRVNQVKNKVSDHGWAGI